MTQTIKISRGTVVGIGKVKIPRTRALDYEIPMLSFLVLNDDQDSFVASCMHVRMDGYGTTEDAAVFDMIDNVNYLLKSNFEKLSVEDAWFNLKDLSHIDERSTELWNAYHDIQLNLASKGVSTDSVENLQKRIDQLQLRIKQLESENVQLKEELSLIVDYIPLETAA